MTSDFGEKGEAPMPMSKAAATAARNEAIRRARWAIESTILSPDQRGPITPQLYAEYLEQVCAERGLDSAELRTQLPAAAHS